MKNSLLLLTTLALPALGGLILQKRGNPSIVKLDIHRKDVPDPVARDRMRLKRDKTVGQTLDNEVGLFRCATCCTSVLFEFSRGLSIIATSHWELPGKACVSCWIPAVAICGATRPIPHSVPLGIITAIHLDHITPAHLRPPNSSPPILTSPTLTRRVRLGTIWSIHSISEILVSRISSSEWGTNQAPQVCISSA